MALSWIKKHEPKDISEIGVHSAQVRELDSFVSGFKSQQKKAVLLYGPSGTGKTVAAYAVARNNCVEILEVNASDFRNKEQIESKVGSASQQMSLFTKGKVILVDEIEGLSGTKDRGGISALAEIIGKSAFPIILTAQDPFDKKFSPVRKMAKLIHFEELGYSDVFEVLKKVCLKEGVAYDEISLKGLARRSGGDLRAAINDLQGLVEESKVLRREDLESLSARNRIETIQSALVRIFKNSDPKIALGAFDNVQEDIDEQLLWIDENLPSEYKNAKDLARAYDFMSLADVFRGRIRRWQHWRFLSYVNEFLTAGIAVSKDERSRCNIDYEQTKRLLKIWAANMKYQKRKAVAAKIAEKTHTSSSRALQDTLPYIQAIFRNSPAKAEELADWLELDSEEAAWLRK